MSLRNFSRRHTMATTHLLIKSIGGSYDYVHLNYIHVDHEQCEGKHDILNMNSSLDTLVTQKHRTNFVLLRSQ